MLAASQQIRFCTAPDGVRLAYATIGKGPPVLRAGHWLTHLEYDLESPVWQPWITALAQEHTLIRYDARGSGLSDWDAPEISFDAWVSDLETVADAAGLARFALLGGSQAAAVAIAYAVRHPERVTRLVIYGGFSRGRMKRASAEQTAEAELEIGLIRLGWGRENPAFRQHFTSGMIPDATLEQMQSFNDLERVSASPENAVRIVGVATRVDVVDLLPRVTVPTLVLHARGDSRVPFEEGRRLASAIPGARFVSLESRNHALLAGEPAWQRFMDEVRAFLAADGGARHGPPAAAPFADLTAREREVLELLARGLANDEIAERLGITPKTVRNQVSALFDKLGVSSRSQAIVKAREAGLGTGGAAE
jgi:pimeloyl-ACP methyl ester carboxylesterase/DNA-binding CsgD family transcriptional regulator